MTNADEIKKAYRKKAREHHPDKNPDDPNAGQKFQEMAAAYEILSQPDSRDAYDQYGMDGVTKGGAGGPSMNEDIFAELFGGLRFGFDFGPGPRGGRRARGEDSVIPYDVSLEDLYNGKTVKMNMEKEVICRERRVLRNRKLASSAKARVGLWFITRSAHRESPHLELCVQIAMDTPIFRCKKCKGRKTVKEKTRQEIYIERGMPDRHKIVLAGAGDEEPGVPPGDVIFVLKTRKHDSFQRAGDNLLATVHITLSEALMGFSRILIKHLDGRGILVSSPPGKVIKTGDTIVLRGEGMPVHKNPDTKGSLYVMLEIDMPDEEWMRNVDKAALAQLLPPKKPEMDPPPEVVDEVAYEQSDMGDVRAPAFGPGYQFFDQSFGQQFDVADEHDWIDEDDEDEDGFGEDPECTHQ
ncbi:uncharacterized protein FIBRA_02099 [Fibroporia radiculosa]|uniref:J domain-containing protein n=1 Tax=Fibroporia radiculosa TaxID=599839 RepID=J4HUD1_9APHY|nr:uncharacterized protein FIBRA_02099 [Fibroporia radiculosa]CCM00072.1 predicted protein [Fibroporia radiculosa]